MRRRIIGIAGAVLLAAAGTLALVGYVQSAKDEAVADEEQVAAFVVRDTLRKGASVDEVREAVERVDIPARVRAEGAVDDLAALDDDLVLDVDLRPGEQLLASRLVEPRNLARADVPEGSQEVTVALDPERAVGGVVRPGDTVGVVLSFDPFEKGGGSKTANVTHLKFHKVLVTAVQFDKNESGASGSGTTGDDSDDGDDGDDEVQRAPSSRLLVTLAVKSPQVEDVVFAAEFGHIWLTAEDEHADESGTRIVTLPDAIGGEVPGA